MQEISISIGWWYKLITGLRKRGGGKRESGGLLLGKYGKFKVHRIVFYDQFDATVSDSGIIQFRGAVALFQYLEKEKLVVLADIHTHPTNDTRQSNLDKNHPIIRSKGHIAIIAPKYASDLLIFPKHCSVYEYLGKFEWNTFSDSKNPIKLKWI